VTKAAALRRVVLLALLGVGALGPAFADGPHIALHATQGRYEITVFTAPDPLVTGPIQLTLLVQDAETGALLPGVEAGGSLTPASGPAVPLTLALGGSSNKELMGETVKLANPGSYTLQLRISAAGRSPQVLTGTLPVDANRGKRNTVLGAVFLALAMVWLFLANQSAKQTGKQRLQDARRRAG
jgi:hypothetical protein